ncbi:doxX family protein [Brevundimonas sp. Leaf363]|nr:doxX family protein [Brevundimonas sp. Leaf363]
MTTTTLTPAQARLTANYRNLALWTAQGWLAMFFVAAGYAKITEPMVNLVTLLSWPATADVAFVRALGLFEIVLAVGVLTPLASWRLGRPVLLASAAGLLALEAVMMGVHLLGADWGLAGVNAVLLALTAPVLWFRRG